MQPGAVDCISAEQLLLFVMVICNVSLQVVFSIKPLLTNITFKVECSCVQCISIEQQLLPVGSRERERERDALVP